VAPAAEAKDTRAAPQAGNAAERQRAGEPGVVDVEPIHTEPHEARTPEPIRAQAEPKPTGSSARPAQPAGWRRVQTAAPETAPREPQVEVLPIPSRPHAPDPPKQERVPFWKRIALHRPATSSASNEPRMPSLEPIQLRLLGLEKQIASNHSATQARLNTFEENITRLWELEDQLALTEVRERLALLEANQEEIADGLHAIARNLTVLAAVLGVSVVAASMGLLLL
jgi:hypothetical protein